MSILCKKWMYSVVFLCGLVLPTADGSVDNDEQVFGEVTVPNKFNYQAEVILDGSPANGQFDFVFFLYSVETGSGGMGSGLVDFRFETLNVTDGLLNTTLDFGGDLFSFQQLWLEVEITDINGTGDTYTLAPRTPINAVPIALVAKSVLNGSIGSGALQPDSVTTSQIANLSVSNAKLQSQSITFAKLANNGASNGDVVQYNGSAWVAAPASGSSPWGNTVDGIRYNGGNVGIGTSFPTGLLHLQGDGSDEISLYGTNSTPIIHFRRLNGAVDWVMKQSSDGTKFHVQTEVSDGNEVLSMTSSGRVGIGTESPDGFLDVRDAAGDTLLNVNADGSIERKAHAKSIYISHKSMIPERQEYDYETTNFFGFIGLESLYDSSGPATFHADVSLPLGALVTQVEMLAADNSSIGEVTASFGYRTFVDVASGTTVVASLISNDVPFAELTSITTNHVVGSDRSYFLNVDINNIVTPGQEVLFGGVRITYETTSL